MIAVYALRSITNDSPYIANILVFQKIQCFILYGAMAITQ